MAKETPTTEDAKKLLLADQEARKAACGKELEELMKKHGCTLDVSMILKNGQAPVTQLSIIAL